MYTRISFGHIDIVTAAVVSITLILCWCKCCKVTAWMIVKKPSVHWIDSATQTKAQKIESTETKLSLICYIAFSPLDTPQPDCNIIIEMIYSTENNKRVYYTRKRTLKKTKRIYICSFSMKSEMKTKANDRRMSENKRIAPTWSIDWMSIN